MYIITENITRKFSHSYFPQKLQPTDHKEVFVLNTFINKIRNKLVMKKYASFLHELLNDSTRIM